MSTAGLHTTELGEQGPRLVFCHGLFGQGKNWTQVAREFEGDHRVVLVDMPDHGRSEWTERFDYVEMADRVAELLSADDPAVLVGHSMGGKAVMILALRHPELVERLCVVDVAPVPYREGGGGLFARFIDGMLELDLDAIERRSDADEALQEAVPDARIRGFLLQNLRRSSGDRGGWRWQLNLELLREGLEDLGGWPGEELAGLPPYEGPVLWMRGEESGYVRDEHAEAMDELFPRNRRVTIKQAGHWVHSEQPEVFVEVLRRFLAA